MRLIKYIMLTLASASYIFSNELFKEHIQESLDRIRYSVIMSELVSDVILYEVSKTIDIIQLQLNIVGSFEDEHDRHEWLELIDQKVISLQTIVADLE